MRYPRCSIQHIRTFVAVHEEKGFGRAAERLNTSQSAVSRTIRDFEAELGEPVFLRHSRGISLTTLGAELLPHAEEAAKTVVEFSQTAFRKLNGTRKIFKIGIQEAAMSDKVAMALMEFQSKEHALDVQLVSLPSFEHSLDGVSSSGSANKFEVTVTADASNLAGFEYHLLYNAHFALAASSSHRFSNKNAVSLDEIVKETIVVADSTTLQLISENAALNPVSGLFSLIKAETAAMALALVKTSSAVALLPQDHVRNAGEGIVKLDVLDSKPTVQVRAAWRSDRSSDATQRFLAVLQSTFNGQQ